MRFLVNMSAVGAIVLTAAKLLGVIQTWTPAQIAIGVCVASSVILVAIYVFCNVVAGIARVLEKENKDGG